MIVDLGVAIEGNTFVDSDAVRRMEQEFDAVFIGIGLGEIQRLGIPGEDKTGLTDALELIAGYKSGSIMQARRRVVVVGAGNTAIDAAIAAVRLGAESVTMIYRRGLDNISAFSFEYEHALSEGVRFEWFAQPLEIVGGERVKGVRLGRMQQTEDGSLIPLPGADFTLDADAVVLAIGQSTHAAFLHGIVRVERGRIVIDRAAGQTSNLKFFAGGDCTNGGREVVDAVADGKRAGVAMAAALLGSAQEEVHADA